MSSHNDMELGKDVLAVDKKGVPCAYQLKGGDITLAKWRSEVGEQMLDLAYGKVVHPSIDASKRHRPFLVTNGQIRENVVRALEEVNQTLKERGLKPIETKVRGDLVDEAKALQSDLWPSELGDAARGLLELYLHDGRDVFPKRKLAVLLESTLPFEKTEKGKPQPKTTCNRAIASAAVLTSLVLSGFTEKGNHVAEVEAWTVYVAYSLALAERWNLTPKYYQAEVRIALQAIENKLVDLAEEVMERDHLAEGLIAADEPFREIRRQWVASLLCVFGLWRRAAGEAPGDVDRFISRFSEEILDRPSFLWGEAAIPPFLAVYWHNRFINARSGRADRLLAALARYVARTKRPGSDGVLPDVYTEAADFLPYLADQSLENILADGPLMGYRLAKEPLDTDWKGYSHALEGLVHLLVQQNLKGKVRELWPDVTRINLHTFRFDEPWHYYRWHNEEGAEQVVVPKRTQHWSDLRAAADDTSGSGLPTLARRYPVFVLLFLCVYPHRTNAAVLRWLNVELREAVRTA